MLTGTWFHAQVAKHDEPDLEPSPASDVAALAESLSQTIATARALVLGGRVVDLAGLNDRAGRLSAAILDLPWPQARALIPRIHQIITEVDQLSAAIGNPAEG